MFRQSAARRQEAGQGILLDARSRLVQHVRQRLLLETEASVQEEGRAEGERWRRRKWGRRFFLFLLFFDVQQKTATTLPTAAAAAAQPGATTATTNDGSRVEASADGRGRFAFASAPPPPPPVDGLFLQSDIQHDSLAAVRGGPGGPAGSGSRFIGRHVSGTEPEIEMRTGRRFGGIGRWDGGGGDGHGSVESSPEPPPPSRRVQVRSGDGSDGRLRPTPPPRGVQNVPLDRRRRRLGVRAAVRHG